MKTNRINIKGILLGILAIVITITIGISIARAEAVPARLSLEKGRDLSLQVAHRTLDLRADLSARLTRDDLLDVVALNRLDLEGGRLDALDNLDLAHFDALDGRLLG